MESLNSQSSLRSLDAIGRSPGTGRSSTQSRGTDEPGADAPHFSVDLERALGNAEVAPSTARSTSKRNEAATSSSLATDTARQERGEQAIEEEPGTAVTSPAVTNETKQAAKAETTPATASLPSASPAAQMREARAEHTKPNAAIPTADALHAALAAVSPVVAAGATSLPNNTAATPNPAAPAAAAPAATAPPLQAEQGFSTIDSEPLAAPLEVALANKFAAEAAPLTDPLPAPTVAATQADPTVLRAPVTSTPLVHHAEATAPVTQSTALTPAPYDAAEAASVLKQVRVEITPGLRRASLHLSPECLGRIEVQMVVEDGEMTAVMRAEKPEALAILERHLPELRAMLDQVGIETNNVDLQLSSDRESSDRDANSERSTNGKSQQPSETQQDTHVLDERALARAIASGVGLDTFA